MKVKVVDTESGIEFEMLPVRFLTPAEYRTKDWTLFDDIRFFTEHPELVEPKQEAQE